MFPKLRKIIASILVMVIACLSLNSVLAVAHGIEEAGFSTPHEISLGNIHFETSGHCPACPPDDHPNTDHDHFSCDHHIYLSLADRVMHRHPQPNLSATVVVEPFQFIPEVYLDKFIPPQNLA